MDRKTSKGLTPGEIALQAIADQIELGRVKVYRNLLNQPYVFCDHPSLPPIHVPLDSPDFHGWLTHFVYKSRQVLIKKHEVNQVVVELSGRSLSNRVNRVTDAAVLRIIETEPVVAALLEFMHTKTRHEAQMEPFWKELLKFARVRKLRVMGKKRFPGGANVLSRKLNQFKTVFESLKLNVDIERSDGSHVTIAKLSDDPTPQSSAVSSDSNSKSDNALKSTDDKATRITRLQNRHLPPEKRKP